MLVLKPVITEKTSAMAQRNVYVFSTSTKVNKVAVKQYIKSVYGVDAKRVNTLVSKGKRVVRGRVQGHTGSLKKVFVEIPEGQSLSL